MILVKILFKQAVMGVSTSELTNAEGPSSSGKVMISGKMFLLTRHLADRQQFRLYFCSSASLSASLSVLVSGIDRLPVLGRLTGQFRERWARVTSHLCVCAYWDEIKGSLRPLGSTVAAGKTANQDKGIMFWVL